MGFMCVLWLPPLILSGLMWCACSRENYPRRCDTSRPGLHSLPFPFTLHHIFQTLHHAIPSCFSF
uniref:Secreted peptide n=1 Tax=Denticeps clupeoides TaxID=299321 RepID=A0A8C4BE31_9TELE